MNLQNRFWIHFATRGLTSFPDTLHEHKATYVLDPQKSPHPHYGGGPRYLEASCQRPCNRSRPPNNRFNRPPKLRQWTTKKEGAGEKKQGNKIEGDKQVKKTQQHKVKKDKNPQRQPKWGWVRSFVLLLPVLLLCSLSLYLSIALLLCLSLSLSPSLFSFFFFCLFLSLSLSLSVFVVPPKQQKHQKKAKKAKP